MNIARVLKPHGSKGEVVVAALRGLPFLLREGLGVCLTPPSLHRDRWVTVEGLRSQGGGAVAGTDDEALVRFSGTGTLDDAEELSGCLVLVRREDVDLGPLDVPYDALLGREVLDAHRGSLGTIREVMETPANDVWVIDGGPFGEILIPVIDAVVSEVPDEGPITVALLDGLIGGA